MTMIIDERVLSLNRMLHAKTDKWKILFKMLDKDISYDFIERYSDRLSYNLQSELIAIKTQLEFEKRILTDYNYCLPEIDYDPEKLPTLEDIMRAISVDYDLDGVNTTVDALDDLGVKFDNPGYLLIKKS